MKILVLNYTFDASEKKITFTDYNPIVIERVLLVTNVTDGIIIYNFADPTKGGTAATNVLTLAYDTTSMSDTDKLQIFYDDTATTQPISGTVTANAGTNLNTSALATSSKQDTQDNSINTLLKPASTLSAVTTLGTITNVVHVDDNSGSLTVDGSVTANAGTNLNTSALALETGGNLASIKTNTDKIPALGQALAAASVPVILPAATITTLTPPAAITGFATSAKQDTGNTSVASIDTKTPALGQALAAASVPVILPAATITTITPPAAITGFALESGGNLTTIAGKDFATQTTLAAINSKMVTGTDIGDVTINNAGGAAAVNIQDGGNSITVDGSVTLGANSGVDIGKLTANQSVNVAQINGVTTLMGAGNTGTGSQRVTIASDQAAVASKAAINTYVDGSLVTLGAKADAKSTATDTTAVTAMSVLKQISASVQLPPGGNIAHDSADSGNPIKVGGRASTTPVTAVAANDRVDAFFDVQGRQIITQKSLTATLSNVDASASSVTLLAANTARLGATIVNDSTVTLYVKFGATASTTSYTVKLIADAYYEVPFGYYGIIDGIWASATGVARVTELT